MDEALEKALTELLTKSTEGIDQAASFLSAEIPDVIQQLLMWHGVYNFTWFVIGILIMIIAVIFNYKQYKWIKEDYKKDANNYDFDSYNWDRGWSFSSFNCIQLAALAIFEANTINIQWLKIWIAPKAWLIDYAATLVSK